MQSLEQLPVFLLVAAATAALATLFFVFAVCRLLLETAVRTRISEGDADLRRRGPLQSFDVTVLVRFLASRSVLVLLILGLNSLSVATTARGFSMLFQDVVPPGVLLAASFATQVIFALSAAWVRSRPALIPVVVFTFCISVAGSMIAIVEPAVRSAVEQSVVEYDQEYEQDLQQHAIDEHAMRETWVNEALDDYDADVIDPVLQELELLADFAEQIEAEMNAEVTGLGRRHGRGIRFDTFRQVADALRPGLVRAEEWAESTTSEIARIRDLPLDEQLAKVRALVARPIPSPLRVGELALPARAERDGDVLDEWVEAVRSAPRLRVERPRLDTEPEAGHAPLPPERPYRFAAGDAHISPHDLLLFIIEERSSLDLVIAAVGSPLIDALSAIAGFLHGAGILPGRRRRRRPASRPGDPTLGPALPKHMERCILERAESLDPADFDELLRVFDDHFAPEELRPAARELLLLFEQLGLLRWTEHGFVEWVEGFRVATLSLLYGARSNANGHVLGMFEVLVELVVRIQSGRANPQMS